MYKSVVGLLMLSAVSFAQAPSAEQMEADLRGPYFTTAPVSKMVATSDFAKRLEPLMVQQARSLIGTLHPWKDDPEALLLTDGNSSEHGIRPNSRVVHGLSVMATMMEPAALSDDLTRRVCIDKSLAMLKFILPTHHAGGRKCSNGKEWYNQWQSALWAFSAGKGAWLLWDHLSPEHRWLAARMICDEADRFVDKIPPAQIKRDTKAEENAWNSLVISLAYNMFPNHPHHEKWRETAIRWAVTSFARKPDTQSEQMLDGRPLKEWLTEPNIYDDFTLENHDRVHPDYMSTINLLISQKPLYDWGGNKTPEALTYNVTGVHKVLTKLSMPDGGVIYPNGQDWQIHRNPIWMTNHLENAILFNDPVAACLAELSLEAIEKMAKREPKGGVYLPEEFFFPSTEMDMLVYLADAYIFAREYGDGPEPMNEAALWKSLEGIHLFESGSFAVCRRPKSVSTFSWGSQVMGMAVPLNKEIMVTPNERSLIGSIIPKGGKKDTVEVVRVNVKNTPDTFSIAGVLKRAGGLAEQRFAFAVLPDGRTVYSDVLTTTDSSQIAELFLGSIGILNEPRWIFGDGRRVITYEGGSRTFTAGAESTETVKLDSPWYNIDDSLGIVCLNTPGEQTYVPLNTWTRGRIEQHFRLNSYSSEFLSKTSGAPRFETTLVLYPDETGERTRAAASGCKSVSKDGLKETLKLDDGATVRIDLETLSVEIKR